MGVSKSGFEFPAGGGTPGTFEHYETFSTSFNFRKAGVAGSQATVTVKGVRVGNSVIIEVPGFTISQANPGGIATNTSLDVNFRPANGVFFVVGVTNQGTKETGTMGHFAVGSDGVMSLFLNTANANWSSGGSPDGMTERGSFSYVI